MIGSILYLALAVFALGFLIFIHELGHYFMARKVGMRVEAFSIGFGKPIIKWMRSGVLWQIGILPFGGFVKIAGMEEENGKEPHEIKDGFFGKSPAARMAVAFTGPLANWLCAFLIFGLIWATNGREKTFSEQTQYIGWMDRESELYEDGVRPGDRLTAYNGYEINNFRDIINFSVLKYSEVNVKGFKVDYAKEQEAPFDYRVKTYPHPRLINGFSTVGIFNTANFLIYDRFAEKIENPLPEKSALQDSGIKYGDRIVWVDGEFVFSNVQLKKLLNDNRILLTIERNGKRELIRVPRIQIVDAKLTDEQKEELRDWQYASGLSQRVTKEQLATLYILPYDLSPNCFVEKKLKLVDPDSLEEVFPKFEKPLQKGDKIIAVDGSPVFQAYDLFLILQERKVNIIVEREQNYKELQSWQEANQDFNKSINWQDLEAITANIGSGKPVFTVGNLTLLNPVTPKRREEVYPLSPQLKNILASKLTERKAEIEKIKDPKEKVVALEYLTRDQDFQKQFVLGLSLQDKRVLYNPSPFYLFTNAFVETKRTLGNLITGNLNPKWLSGPIGIVQGMQHFGLTSGIKEFLYWIAIISFSLGFLNLLPIPPLDGGYILLSIGEMILRRPIKAKVLKRLVVPFAILLIGLIVFATFNDILRLITRFF